MSPWVEEESLAGLQRIPRAVAEIDRVEHDTKGLQSRIQAGAWFYKQRLDC